jgi:hypothetical protein
MGYTMPVPLSLCWLYPTLPWGEWHQSLFRWANWTQPPGLNDTSPSFIEFKTEWQTWKLEEISSGEIYSSRYSAGRPVRERVSTDSLKFHVGPPCPTIYALQAGHPPNGLMAVWGVARSQGGRPAAVFFPLGYPFPYEPECEGGRHCQADHAKIQRY